MLASLPPQNNSVFKAEINPVVTVANILPIKNYFPWCFFWHKFIFLHFTDLCVYSILCLHATSFWSTSNQWDFDTGVFYLFQIHYSAPACVVSEDQLRDYMPSFIIHMHVNFVDSITIMVIIHNVHLLGWNRIYYRAQ